MSVTKSIGGLSRGDRTPRGRRPAVAPLEPRVLLATITVKSAGEAVAADAELTLPEAILVANGERSLGDLSDAERGQITGALESTQPDTMSVLRIPDPSFSSTTFVLKYGETSDVAILGNRIGVGRDNVTPIPNQGDGIKLTVGTDRITIGGTAPGAGNLIAHNGVNGVATDPAGLIATEPSPPTFDVAILGNSIFNGGLAIDLNFDGPTANDRGDNDTGPGSEPPRRQRRWQARRRLRDRPASGGRSQRVGSRGHNRKRGPCRIDRGGRRPRVGGSITMRAMLLRKLGTLRDNPAPLEPVDWPDPTPGAGEVRIRVSVCGVCHTELDEIEGRTPPPRLPVIPGHQVVGTVEAVGPDVEGLRNGDRVGVAWIFAACGRCAACRRGEENLCSQFLATGRDANGGYAEQMTAPAAFCHPIPEVFSNAEAAPLLCAGAIGYRSLRLSGIEDGQTLGLTGFGASAHLVLKLARHRFPNARVFVFARSELERAFALELGAAWAGDTADPPPVPLRAIIDTTPAWTPVVKALGNLEPGGRLVVNAIRKEETDQDALLLLDYPRDLWLEKEIKSVANVTRADVREFLSLAAEIPLKPEVREYALGEANRALLGLKIKAVRGATVLRIS